jgi:hypothetical protein
MKYFFYFATFLPFKDSRSNSFLILATWVVVQMYLRWILGLSPRAFAKAVESQDQKTCKLFKQENTNDLQFEGDGSPEIKFKVI